MMRKLDIVVGGQFGDEGKGVSAAMLHLEKNYDFAVRTGGSQAEHRYKYHGKDYRFRVLPSIAGIDPGTDVDYYIAAGAVVRKDILEREVKENNIDPNRVFIDYNTAVVRPRQIDESKHTAAYDRGGYSMGISGTLARKMRRSPTDVITARDFNWDGIAKVTSVNTSILERILKGNTGIIEGSQGALLSLDHGYYPHTTSYNVTTAGVLSQLGLGFDYIRDVYMVVKTFPTRVAGKSGYMAGDKTTFDEISKMSGVIIPQCRRQQNDEGGSSMGEENVARFSITEYEHALMLNTPTQIIITHTDWMDLEDFIDLIPKIRKANISILGRPIPVSYTRFGEEIQNYCRNLSA